MASHDTHLKPSRTSVMVRCSSSHSWPFHAISQGIRLLPQLYRPLCRFRSASAGGSFGMLAPCSRASRNRGPRSVLRFRCCGRIKARNGNPLDPTRYSAATS